MIVVLDTNVLVSGLWTPSGNSSRILSSVISGSLQVCYDHRIMEEYWDVLSRPKFHFPPSLVRSLLDHFIQTGLSIVAMPLPDVEMPDEDDRPFYEVACACNALLITGNIRDYPPGPPVITPADFCSQYLGS